MLLANYKKDTITHYSDSLTGSIQGKTQSETCHVWVYIEFRVFLLFCISSFSFCYQIHSFPY